MLPEFVTAKKALRDLFNRELFRSFHKAAPFAHMATHRVQHEGKTSHYETEQRKIEEIDYQLQRVEFTIDYAPGKGGTVEEIFTKAEEAGRAFGEKLERSLFQQISEVTEKVGNVIDMEGKAFDGQAFADLIEKIDTDFDEHGNPKSMLVVTPAMAKLFEERREGWEKDIALVLRLKEIRATKIEAFRAREANRRLVN